MSDAPTAQDAGSSPVQRNMEQPCLDATARPFMKKCLSSFVLCIGLLAGCARHYNLTLTNGTVITTSSKPRLENGSYHFKDASGKDVYIPSFRVREIAPVSMSKDSKTTFKAASPR